MYSIVNIILIILSCQNIRVLCFFENEDLNIDLKDTPDGQHDCYVKPIRTQFDAMPIIFMKNYTSPYIIRPNREGYYHFRHNTNIMLSCLGSSFVLPPKVSTREIVIQCYNGFLRYRNKPKILSQFQCSKIPHSKLLMTNITCHGLSRYKLIIVGFITTSGMIPVYKICYDTVGKSPLYSWMHVDAPVNKYRQVSIRPLKFIHTDTYDEIIPLQAYENQELTLEKILNSKSLATHYIKKPLGKHYLTQCFLTPKNVFPYIFQQEATNYFENTVPMWLEFSNFAWTELEVFFRKTMIRGGARHAIITGTYGLLSFEDKYSNVHPVYLKLPMKMKVPLYIWKMFYDLDTDRGTVFIGFNNPYREIDPSIFFCETIKCPGHVARRNTKRDLIFCCTKQSFERSFGELDSEVYKIF